MDPATGAAVGQTALGLIGTLFGGRRRRSASELLAEESLKRRSALGARASALAEAYDPGVETADSVRFAQDVAERSIQSALRRLNQDFRSAGGSPTGDTQFAVNASRAVEDVANPLREFAAQRRADEIVRRMRMLGAAAGMESPNDAMQMALAQEGLRPDQSASQMLLAGGLDRLMSRRPAQPGAAADKGRRPIGKGGRGFSGYQIRPPSDNIPSWQANVRPRGR